jgi:hypothetical protein
VVQEGSDRAVLQQVLQVASPASLQAAGKAFLREVSLLHLVVGMGMAACLQVVHQACSGEGMVAYSEEHPRGQAACWGAGKVACWEQLCVR